MATTADVRAALDRARSFVAATQLPSGDVPINGMHAITPEREQGSTGCTNDFATFLADTAVTRGAIDWNLETLDAGEAEARSSALLRLWQHGPLVERAIDVICRAQEADEARPGGPQFWADCRDAGWYEARSNTTALACESWAFYPRAEHA